MAFTKPGPGATAGVTRLTRERLNQAHEFVKDITDDPQYRANLKTRALSGNLAPNLEALLLYYRFGKPTDNVTVEQVSAENQDLSQLTDEQLSHRALAVAKSLEHFKSAMAERGEAPDITGNPQAKTPDRIM